MTSITETAASVDPYLDFETSKRLTRFPNLAFLMTERVLKPKSIKRSNFGVVRPRFLLPVNISVLLPISFFK